MNLQEFRSSVLFDRGASLKAATGLLKYNENPFDHSRLAQPLRFPLATELHVEAWERYAAEAQEIGVLEALQRHLVQLCFPIHKGISQTEPYRAATSRGVPVAMMRQATGLRLKRPDKLQLILHHSLAGVIPVLLAGHRDDFVALVRALTKHNEPEPIPDSMGASIVSGYNNWSRIDELRLRWEAEKRLGAPIGDWMDEFQQHVLPHKELYQDRFILLSPGPYSGVAARDMGLPANRWRQISVTIRLEHECTHYLTRRLFAAMRNNALDELLADYRGIVAGNGRYRADWFLRFLGLEAFPAYRDGGRLQNYRGDPALSDEAFAVLQGLVKDAASNLEHFDQDHAKELTIPAQGRLLIGLTRLTLEELASKQAGQLIQEAVHSVPSFEEVQS